MHKSIKKILALIAGIVVALLVVVTPSFAQKNNVPELNKKVVAYVKSVIGKQVDRGECWDLANQALNRNKAEWNGEYIYGKLVKPGKDVIYPGDIIQFEGVKVKYTKNNTTYTETMAHHTAVVYRVLGEGKYELAHQNTGFSGKKVGLSELDLANVTKGKIKFYRPVAKKA